MDNNLLRPESITSFVGQDPIKDRLVPILNEAKADRAIDPYTRLPHMLLLGEPGLGKTTLANLIAWEMDEEVSKVDLSQMTAARLPMILSNIGSSIIFLDELHRATKAQQQLLLEFLEEGQVNTAYGWSKDVSEYTVLGATTEPKDLDKALRTRFQVELEFLPYTPEAIAAIIQEMALTLKLTMPEEVALGLGQAAIGNPRTARDLVLAYRTLSRMGDQPDLAQVLKFVDREPDGLKGAHVRYLKVLEDYGVAGEVRLVNILRLHPAYIREIESTLIRLKYVYPGPQGRVLLPAGAARLATPRRRRSA